MNNNDIISVFNQAAAELKNIRANYQGTIVLTNPRIFSAAASSLKVVWLNAATGLHSSRYPELLTCIGRINQVEALFMKLDKQIVDNDINFYLINSPDNLDALLMAHLGIKNISQFAAIEDKYAFPANEQINRGFLTAELEAASEFLLETYKILRDE